jgi:LuxR family transcriptional regulator, maltose regulon positive regulatory protein
MARTGHLPKTMSIPEADPGSPFAEQGRAALAQGAWEDAVEALRAATGERPQDASSWELLGIAHMWLQEADPAIEARQRAYALYRERGDDAASARVSLELANDFFEVRGEPAVANGWFQRARRLLAELPPSPEHALLKVWDAYMALMAGADPQTAEAHAAEGVAVACATGARDVGVLSLALEGLACVGQGRVPEGLDLLDEAVAGAIGGEVTDPQWFYLTCCCMIDACDQVRDYGRSLEWCRTLREFCDRWRVRAFLTNCRLKFTGALLWRGEWERCEEELERAAEELRRNRPGSIGGALVRLAELRRRQGRRDEAERLLEECAEHPLALQVRAALALDEGDGEAALDTLGPLLRQLPATARTERAGALELVVRAHLAAGEVDEAGAAAHELAGTAETVGTPALRATALLSEGIVAAARSESGEARRRLEDAVRLLQESGSRFETARARMELARCLAAEGRRSAAVRQAGRAADALDALGAALEAEKARALLHHLEEEAAAADGTGQDAAGQGTGQDAAAGSVSAGEESATAGRNAEHPPPDGPAPAAGPKGPLTRRQREVLALVAEGLSDREIAGRLYLSEHTVHRHVSNIMERLRVGSRAAAVARGVREELI